MRDNSWWARLQVGPVYVPIVGEFTGRRHSTASINRSRNRLKLISFSQFPSIIPRTRSRSRANQDRPTLGLHPRRSPVGRTRAARRRLCLCPGPQARTASQSSCRLCGPVTGRRLRPLSSPSETRQCDARLLLGACAPPFLRNPGRDARADRRREPYRRTLAIRLRQKHARKGPKTTLLCPLSSIPPWRSNGHTALRIRSPFNYWSKRSHHTLKKILLLAFKRYCPRQSSRPIPEVSCEY